MLINKLNCFLWTNNKRVGMSYYESDDIEKESDIKLRKQEQQNIGHIINNIQQRITHQLNTMITVEDNLSHIIIIKNFIDTLKSEISAKKHLKLNLGKVISNGAVNELNGALNYLRLKDDFLNEQFELLKQKEMNINIRQKVIKGIMNNKIKNINNISSKQYYYTKRKKTPFDKATNIKLNNNVQFDNSYKLFMLLEKVITHNNLLKQFIKVDKACYSKRNKTKVLCRKTKSAKDISKYPSKQYLLTNLDSKSSKEGYSYIRKYSDNVREYDRYKGRTVCYDEDMKYEQVNSTIISKNDMKDVENIKRGIKDKIKSTIRSIHAKGINSDNNNNSSSVLETPVYTNANISFAGTFGQMKVKLVNTPVCSPPPNEDLRESYSTGQLHLQELKDKISELSKCNNNNNNNNNDNNIEDTSNNIDNECIPKMKSTNDLTTKINDKRKSEINLIKGRRRYINGNSFINVFNRSNNSIQQSESGRHKFLRQNKSLRSNKKTEELNSFLDSLLLSTKKTLEHDNYSQEALATQGSFQIGRFSLTKEHNNTQHEICDSPFARFLKTTTNMIIPQMQIQPSETENETESEPYNNSNNYILGCSAFHVRTRNNFPNLTQDNKDDMIKLNSDDNINILSNRKLFQSPLSNTYSLNERKNILADLLNEDDLCKDDNEMNANSKGMMPITEHVNVSSSYECDCDDKREQIDEGRSDDVGIRSSEKKDTEKSQCLYFENGIPPSHKKHIEEFMSGSSSSFSDEKSYPILISPLKRSTKINFSQFSIDNKQQHQYKNNVDVSNSSNIINMNNLSVKNSLNCSSSKELIQEIKNVFIHNNNNNNNNSRNIIEHEMKVMPHIFNTETINESKSKVNHNNNNNKQYLTEIKHNNTFTLNSNNNNNNNNSNSNSFVQDKFKQLQDKYKINSSSTNKDKKHTRHLSKFNNENSLINSNIHFVQELNFEDNNDNNLTIHPNKYSTNNSHHLKHTQHEDNIYLDNNEYIQEYYSCSHNGQTKNDNKHYITTKHEHNNIIELDFKEEDKIPQKKNITIYLDCSSESNNEDNVNQDIITPQSIPLGIDCCYSQRKYNEHNNVNQGILTPQSIPLGIDYVPFENNNNNNSEIMTPQSIPLGINYCYNNNNNKQESHNDDEMLLIYSIDKTIKSNNSNCLYNGMERYVNVNENDKQNVNIEQHDIKAINKEIESNFHDILNSKSSINYNLSLTSSSIISEDHQRCMLKSKEINNESVNVSKYKDNSFSINDQENLHMKEIKEQLTRNRLNNNNNNNNIGSNIQEIPFKTNNLCINNNNNNKQPLISTTVIDNQDKTITKETEIPSSPQDPFYHKNQLNNSNYINNQYNGNSELALIEMPSNKANIPKQNTYTYINNSTFSIYSQDNNNNNNQNNILITESCPIYLTNSNNNNYNYVEESTVSVCLSGLLDESFESRKTTFHPSKRPYLFPKSSSSAIIHAEEDDSLHIAQPPRKTIGAIITSQNNPLLKYDIINKYHLINLKHKHNSHNITHNNNLKDIIITENIKKAINHITTNIFKKHIFNLLKQITFVLIIIIIISNL